MPDLIKAEEIAKTRDATMEEAEQNKVRILRFLSRAATYKDNPLWTGDPSLSSVYRRGVLSVDDLRVLYAERNIMNEKQFVQAYEALVSEGMIESDEPTAKGLAHLAAKEQEQELIANLRILAREL